MHSRFLGTQFFTLGCALSLLTGGCFLFPPPHSDYRPIHQFSLACNDQAVSSILQTNASAVDLKDDSKRTPLHDAASRNCTNVIQVLLHAGAKIDAKDQAGETPLHVAAQEGWVDVISQLVQAGADVNARDGKGYTPLKRALLYEQTAAADALRGVGGKE